MEGKQTKEKERIEDAILVYVEGVQEFNFDKAESSWHSKGVKIFYNESKASLDMVTMLQSRPDGKPVGEISQRAEIKEINRVGQAATVLLQWFLEKNGSKAVITDFISLLQINNQWKIVAKVFDIKKLED
ncbi:MAG: nuclear transport factor 2 family protein [Candidatus Heimdallarchaeaceae archaeon]